MTIIHLTRPLEHHERLFVGAVRDHLRDLPKADRAELLAAARANLADRPPTSDRWQLWAQLDPRVYAAELRAERSLPPERTDWYSRWIARSRKGRYLGALAVVVLIIATTIGVVEYQRWVSYRADIVDEMWALESPSGRPLAGRLSTAGTASQQTVRYQAGAVFTLDSELVTGAKGVTITQVTLGQGELVTLEGVERADRRIPRSWPAHRPFVVRWHPFRPVHLDTDDGSIRFRLRFDGCQHLPVGVTETYDRIYVRYRADGRDRVEEVALPETLAIPSPPDSDCPRRPIPAPEHQ